MDANVLVTGAIGVLLVAAGAGVARGRLDLLANYQPGAVDDERRVARIAGGTIVGYGVATGLLAVRLRAGGSADAWWLGWTLVTLAVAFGVAAVASGRA
ncbi:hypothetical protein [Halorussus marinus]|uniref:hypothetical protein n=1 Tax=Halorussus marinus TaxID=2505976 RepID=UPI001092FEB2|nr:hypothetical protein [Halorussus marinus]